MNHVLIDVVGLVAIVVVAGLAMCVGPVLFGILMSPWYLVRWFVRRRDAKQRAQDSARFRAEWEAREEVRKLDKKLKKERKRTKRLQAEAAARWDASRDAN